MQAPKNRTEHIVGLKYYEWFSNILKWWIV